MRTHYKVSVRNVEEYFFRGANYIDAVHVYTTDQILIQLCHEHGVGGTKDLDHFSDLQMVNRKQLQFYNIA